MSFGWIVQYDFIKEASHDKIAFSVNINQIVIILLIAEKTNDVSVKEKTFQVNDIAYADECSKGSWVRLRCQCTCGLL